MKSSARGVTLIELMTVVVIVAILASIAIPGYRQYLLRTNRTDAKVELTSVATFLERCYTRWGAYNSANCDAKLPRDAPSGTYRISFAKDQPTATTFTLEAAPQGPQAKDTECGTFTINQANQRTAGKDTCWGR